MAASDGEMVLSALFSRALQTSSKVLNLPSIEDETQASLAYATASALADLQTLTRRINTLGLFSSNETFEELSIRSAAFMFVPYVSGDMQLRVRAIENEDRMAVVKKAAIALSSFTQLMEDYGVLPEQDKKLHLSPPPADPSKRRELKIAQFKAEKSIRSAVENLQLKRGSSVTASSGSTDFDIIAGLLPSSSESGDEDEDEEQIRNLLRAVFKLFWIQAIGHLNNLKMEVEMLRSAPPKPSSSQQESARKIDDSWKLDMPLNGSPLLDKSGRPLRPFTILPSGAGERARLQAEVFRPDHRLPTMTIDEYLEEERRRGNIITGGGEASANQKTSKEILQEAAEMDGTLEGDEKSEQKRREEEEWALYVESHPKGMGNTMNRG